MPMTDAQTQNERENQSRDKDRYIRLSIRKEKAFRWEVYLYRRIFIVCRMQ